MQIYRVNTRRLDDIKFFLLLLMTISLPFSESIKTISLLICSIVFLIQTIKREATITLSISHYGFIMFFFSSILSGIFADIPSRSFSGSKDVLFYAITFFIAYSINQEKKIRTLLWGLYVSTTLSAFTGIFNSIVIHRPLEIHSIGNQNYTAMFFTIVITSMISTAMFSNKETPLMKSTLIIFSVITTLASVMTLMRASFLGLFAFFVLLILLNLKKSSRTVPLCVVGFVLLTVVLLYSDTAMWQKLFSFQSMISRIDIWGGATKALLENPLTGVGLNHFEFRFPQAHPVEPNNTVHDAHSLYFQVASQMGLLGLISLSVLFYGFIKALKSFNCSSGFCRSLKWGALGAFLVIAITGIFDTTLHHEHAMAFTLNSGLAFGYIKGQRSGL